MNRSDSRAVIVFDGVCALCSGWVGFLLKHDRRQRYRFAAMQTSAGKRLLQAHGLDPDDPLSFLLVEDGVARTDSDAIVAVLTGLGGVWRAASVFRFVPRALRDPAYRWLARNRYRWFGKKASCYLPTPEQSHRFL
ncbi:MAG TPA: thiol-disulfide oxidoreductase DCC family protein [Luteimonas sp.]|nr:thiol-disulfide oxidoreductase DCC family protein [Luteimonas sp.]